jgi:hypothetical protein
MAGWGGVEVEEGEGRMKRMAGIGQNLYTFLAQNSRFV